jgi:hypothetical protein
MSEEFLGEDKPPVDSQKPVDQPAKAQEGKAEGNSDYSDFLEAITNSEGRPKYKTVADALLGAAKAQEHIARIETENSELRGLQTKVSGLEALIAKLETGKQVDQPVQPKVEDQESLVISVLEKRDAFNAARANRQKVLDTITAKFGDKTNDMLKQQADDLGLTLQEMGDWAARSPKAVLKLFGAEAKGTPTVKGTVNTEALRPDQKPADAPANLLWGASTKDQVSFLRQIKEEVNKEYGL